MKKMLLALLATTVCAHAAESITGFYLGANAGLGQTNVDYRATAPAAAAAWQYDNKIPAGKAAGLFGLFAGYGRTFGCFYTGAEVSFGFDTTKLSPLDNSDQGNNGDQISLKTRVSRNNYYGLALRLGGLFTAQNLIYGKLGFEGGKWNFRSENLQSSALVGGDKIVNKSKSGVNLVLGAGLETHFKNRSFFRVEYSWLRGPTLRTEQKATNFGTLSSSAKITQHRLTIGAGYRF